MFFFDPTFIIIIPGLLLALYAQFKVKSTFANYAKVRASSGLTGAQVAKGVMEEAGIHDVRVEFVEGNLSDHYDPKAKVLRLSSEVYSGNSLSSLGVAAHEAGHAIQHANSYFPLSIRSSFVPVAQIGSTLAFPLFFIGLLFGRGTGSWLLWAGIYMFMASVLFQIITLPVEFNASRRALVALQAGNYVTSSESKGAKKVLDAAALTYVAAAVMGILQLLRLLFIAGAFGRRDD